MQLTHLGPLPLKLTDLRDEVQSPGTWWHKPNGFWLAEGDAWINFSITAFGYGTNDGPRLVLHEVKLLKSANILRLPSVDALQEFSERFGHWDDRLHAFRSGVNWCAVAKEYDGIEIIPYQSMLRHELLWYYSWDIPSACIWRPSVTIRSIRVISEADAEKVT